MPNMSSPIKMQRQGSCKTLDIAETLISQQSGSAELSAVLGSRAGWGRHCRRGWTALCTGEWAGAAHEAFANIGSMLIASAAFAPCWEVQFCRSVESQHHLP